MRVLITRPSEDAKSLAQQVEQKGYEACIAPLMTVQTLQKTIEIKGVQALLATSANGVRALSAASPERTLPLFAVGQATANAAKSLGYLDVVAAGGDVAFLADLVKGRLDPKGGALFHGAGKVLSGDLQGLLIEAGFEVRREILYDARPVDKLPTEIVADLSAGRIDVALLFSPRTASVFETLLERHNLRGLTKNLRLICLSASVADALANSEFLEVRVPGERNQDAVLRELDAVAQQT
jgi:uroporphyrinogen-III synthase